MSLLNHNPILLRIRQLQALFRQLFSLKGSVSYGRCHCLQVFIRVGVFLSLRVKVLARFNELHVVIQLVGDFHRLVTAQCTTCTAFLVLRVALTLQVNLLHRLVTAMRMHDFLSGDLSL